MRIYGPNGKPVHEDSKTNNDTNGISGSFSYKIPSKDAAGTYTIKAYASNSTTAGDDGQFINVSVKILAAVPVEDTVSYSFKYLNNDVWTTDEYKKSKFYQALISLDQSLGGSAANANGLIAVAKSQLGYHEGNEPENGDFSALQGNTAGNENFTEYMCSYNEKILTSGLANNQAWCAYFVTWCARRAGISDKIIPDFSGCTPAVNSVLPDTCNAVIYKPNMAGSWRPAKGDLIFFNGDKKGYSGHVGIVDSVNGDSVYYYDGNGASYSGDKGESDNHTEVDYRRISWNDSHIYGFADIHWSGTAQSTYEPHRPLALYKYMLKGPDVKWVQKKLKELGYYSETEDGIFGTKTDTAVRDFQSANNLTVNGEVDAVTLAALKAAKPYNPQQQTSENPSIEAMISNIRNNNTYKWNGKKQVVIDVAERLLGKYEPAYVAGVLGNMMYESGVYGKLENSNYDSQDKNRPAYFAYLDGIDHYYTDKKTGITTITHYLSAQDASAYVSITNGKTKEEAAVRYSKANFYRNTYSAKNMSDFDYATVRALLNDLKNGQWKGFFGIGIIQWSNSRSWSLIEKYDKVIGTNTRLTVSQMKEAELNLLEEELFNQYQGSRKNNVFDSYTHWLNDGAQTAYRAGAEVSKRFIRPGGDSDAQAQNRGDAAAAIYNIMVGN